MITSKSLVNRIFDTAELNFFKAHDIDVQNKMTELYKLILSRDNVDPESFTEDEIDIIVDNLQIPEIKKLTFRALVSDIDPAQVKCSRLSQKKEGCLFFEPDICQWKSRTDTPIDRQFPGLRGNCENIVDKRLIKDAQGLSLTSDTICKDYKKETCDNLAKQHECQWINNSCEPYQIKIPDIDYVQVLEDYKSLIESDHDFARLSKDFWEGNPDDELISASDWAIGSFEWIKKQFKNDICISRIQIFHYVTTTRGKTYVEVLPSFDRVFENCLTEIGTRFIVIQLKLMDYSTKQAHANTLFVDKHQMEVERYEPHGAESGLPWTTSENIDNDLREFFTNWNIRYIPPMEVCPSIVKGRKTMGHQEFEGLLTDMLKTGGYPILDIGGFCQTWVVLWSYLRLANPDIDRQTLFQKSHQVYTRYGLNISEFMTFFHLYIRMYVCNNSKKRRSIITKNTLIDDETLKHARDRLTSVKDVNKRELVVAKEWVVDKPPLEQARLLGFLTKTGCGFTELRSYFLRTGDIPIKCENGEISTDNNLSFLDEPEFLNVLINLYSHKQWVDELFPGVIKQSLENLISKQLDATNLAESLPNFRFNPVLIALARRAIARKISLSSELKKFLKEFWNNMSSNEKEQFAHHNQQMGLYLYLWLLVYVISLADSPLGAIMGTRDDVTDFIGIPEITESTVKENASVIRNLLTESVAIIPPRILTRFQEITGLSPLTADSSPSDSPYDLGDIEFTREPEYTPSTEYLPDWGVRRGLHKLKFW